MGLAFDSIEPVVYPIAMALLKSGMERFWIAGKIYKYFGDKYDIPNNELNTAMIDLSITCAETDLKNTLNAFAYNNIVKPFEEEILNICFKDKEEINFFKDLLETDNILNYLFLFDFRDEKIKRKEFNKQYKRIMKYLIEYYGKKCLLKTTPQCNINDGIHIDHLIPLSTNLINKKIRNIEKEFGKKVKTQSFGSNDIRNLIITCKHCNNNKKNRFLTKEKYKDLIDKKKIF